ncbi:hypothetical protein BKA66DRAFT_547067 [Pyrenochaeta sp. MPI-SDFR-AT-0127]|nr:hypothetical protein BKA66DRAFT_547067 [Pyrenochaeta sp. MPI-SDFR-AT-0127]
MVSKAVGDSRQQTADSRQQTADSRQQTADSRQQTADSRQQLLGRAGLKLEGSLSPMSRRRRRAVEQKISRGGSTNGGAVAGDASPAARRRRAPMGALAPRPGAGCRLQRLVHGTLRRVRNWGLELILDGPVPSGGIYWPIPSIISRNGSLVRWLRALLLAVSLARHAGGSRATGGHGGAVGCLVPPQQQRPAAAAPERARGGCTAACRQGRTRCSRSLAALRPGCPEYASDSTAGGIQA